MPSRDKPSRDKASDREAKLAQALRANLRRRKAGERPPKPPADDPKSAEGR